RRGSRPASRLKSYQGRLQNNATINYAGGVGQDPGGLGRDLRAVGQLAEQVDQAPHRPDQVPLVAAESLLDDPAPVVFARRPAVDRRHEPGVDGDRDAEMARPLRLVHGVGHPHEELELALELGTLLQERARERRVTRSRLLDQRRADGRRLRARDLGERAVGYALGDEQLVVVPKVGDEPALPLELPVAHGAELLEHLDDTEELLPVGAAERLELPPPDPETLGDGLELAPLSVAARGRAPRAAMALDRRERGLGTLGALAIDQLGDRQPLQLDRQLAQAPAVGTAAVAAVAIPAVVAPAAGPSAIVRAAIAPVVPAVARDVERRRGPEDALDDPALNPHRRPVRQERVDQHAVAADRVDPEHHREGRRAAAADQHQPPRLGFGHRPLAALAAAAPQRLAARLDFLARAAVAPDPLELAAGRRVAP